MEKETETWKVVILLTLWLGISLFLIFLGIDLAGHLIINHSLSFEIFVLIAEPLFIATLIRMWIFPQTFELNSPPQTKVRGFRVEVS